ncbi:chaplin [Streptomyces sp. NPDC018693]
MIACAAASGAVALTTPAHADASTDGSATGSPGAISGNSVRLPVNLPVTVCGNTADVIGVLNPAIGTACADEGRSEVGGAWADTEAAHSPGLASGNGIQLPVDLPVDVSGNTADIVGVRNPATGNGSAHTPGEEPPIPAPPAPRPPTVPTAALPKAEPGPVSLPEPRATRTLARTGADTALPALLGSTALILGGAILYRRFRRPGPC